MESQKFKME